jgi:hypothetical protein
MGVLRPIIFTAIVLQVCLMTYGVLVYVSPPAVADGVGRGGAASRVRAVSDTLPSRKRSAMSRIAAALTRAVSRGGRAGRSPREIIAAVLKRRATHARAVTLLVVSDWGLRGRGLMRVTGAVQKICETRRRGANKDLGCSDCFFFFFSLPSFLCVFTHRFACVYSLVSNDLFKVSIGGCVRVSIKTDRADNECL